MNEGSSKRGGRRRTLADLQQENDDLRRELEVYRTLAYRDPLTGLWNRRYFEDRLTEELSRVSRAEGRPLSVMFIDVNDLKAINDRHGHAEGDRTIQWVGQFLKAALRAHDVCCRIGGDEFAVIVPELGVTDCERMLGRLARALARENQTRAVPVGLAFGTATAPEQGRTVETLIDAADAAMYRDKRRQKGIGDEPRTPSPVIVS